MPEVLKKFKEEIIEVLIPRKCLGCGREGAYICQNCSVFLSEVDLGESNDLMSVWEYEGIIKKAILKIKKEGCYDIINELMEKVFERIEINLPKETVIAYVPMFKKKEKERGFNQARLIAEKIGEKTGNSVIGLLEKAKDTPLQEDLSLDDRLENNRGAFSAKITGKEIQSVLLIDDFCVTGATFNECRKALKEEGIKNILFLTLALQTRI